MPQRRSSAAAMDSEMNLAVHHFSNDVLPATRKARADTSHIEVRSLRDLSNVNRSTQLQSEVMRRRAGMFSQPQL